MEEKRFYIYIVGWESFWDGKEDEYPFTIWSFQKSYKDELKRLIISPEPVNVGSARNNFTRPVISEIRILEPWEVEYYKDNKCIVTAIENKYDGCFELKKMIHNSVKKFHEREDGAILDEFEIFKLIFKDDKNLVLVPSQFELIEELL